MDYKKKYEEALGKAKKLMSLPDDKAMLEEIFPGLKELEDEEKPNGGIVLEDFNEGEGFYKVNLAYLNKEQVVEIEELVKKWNPELKESEDDRIRKAIGYAIGQSTNSEGTLINGVYSEEALAWLEKQGEQKHWDSVEPVNEEDKLYLMKGEQNSAWSEEDEAMLLLVGIILNNHKGDPDFTIYNTSFEASIAWLKSIKERYTWKPSEESFNNTSCTHLSKKEAESKVWKQ